MANVALRMVSSIFRNVFILIISLLCCRCRHRVLRMLGLDKSAGGIANSSLEGVHVQSSSPTSKLSFGQWENWEPALPAPKNKALAAKMAAQKTEDEEPEPDYFSDMAPRVTKPPLIVKKSREITKADPSKLALKEDLFPQLSPELSEWQDDTQASSTEGWSVDVASSPGRDTRRSHHASSAAQHHHSKHSRPKGRPR